MLSKLQQIIWNAPVRTSVTKSKQQIALPLTNRDGLCENCKRLTENDKKDNGVMRLTEGFDYYAHGNENTIKI